MSRYESRFEHNPSEDFLVAVTALRKLRTGEANSAYAEATHKSLKEEYGLHRGLKLRTSNHVCVRRLAGARSCSGWGSGACNSPNNIPGFDHGSEWMKDGRTYCITFEPYGLYDRVIDELMEFCRTNDFACVISAGSFYYPHATLLVELRRKENA